jgi:hypothetical protein
MFFCLLRVYMSEDLKATVKEWLILDNEMREIQRILKEKKERKKNLTENVIELMKAKQVDELNVNDGKLIYSQTKTKSPLNKQHISSCLGDVFKNEPEKVAKLTEHILNSRQIKVKDNLKRKVDK